MNDICVRVTSGDADGWSFGLLGQENRFLARTSETRFADIFDTEMRITQKALPESAVKWIPRQTLEGRAA